jgi:hypothetical protein
MSIDLFLGRTRRNFAIGSLQASREELAKIVNKYARR